MFTFVKRQGDKNAAVNVIAVEWYDDGTVVVRTPEGPKRFRVEVVK